MIYFDNAATTRYKSPEVIKSALDCINNSYNANRGNSSGVNELMAQIFATRQKIARLVNAKQEDCVAFTKNCTEALNIAILGSVKRNGHIIASVTEHNSVIRPIMELVKRGIVQATFVQPDEQGDITTDIIKQAIKPNTYMAVFSHVSNVTGKKQDIETIGKFLFSYGVTFVADCAQSMGYLPIDMEKYHIDMLAFPSHKGLHGLQGSGALVFKPEQMPSPIMYGGTGSDSANIYQPNFSPDCFESGTLNAPSILGLSTAVDWWLQTRKDNLPKIVQLQKLLKEQLEQLPTCKVYSPFNASGIVAFELENYDSDELGEILSSQGIVTRSGLHCAPLMHKHLQTQKKGLVRVSLSGENTVEECFTLISLLDKLANQR
ncbi:MAG: aminotransferase class V-fold PLP-dependent enzyme [Clostridia bacterium]